MPVGFSDYLVHYNPNLPLLRLDDNVTRGFGVFTDTTDRDSLNEERRADGFIAVLTTDNDVQVFHGDPETGWATASNWTSLQSLTPVGTLGAADQDIPASTGREVSLGTGSSLNVLDSLDNRRFVVTNNGTTVFDGLKLQNNVDNGVTGDAAISWYDSTSTNNLTIKAPSSFSANYELTLPTAAPDPATLGTGPYALTSNADGTMQWSSIQAVTGDNLANANQDVTAQRTIGIRYGSLRISSHNEPYTLNHILTHFEVSKITLGYENSNHILISRSIAGSAVPAWGDDVVIKTLNESTNTALSALKVQSSGTYGGTAFSAGQIQFPQYTPHSPISNGLMSALLGVTADGQLITMRQEGGGVPGPDEVTKFKTVQVDGVDVVVPFSAPNDKLSPGGTGNTFVRTEESSPGVIKFSVNDASDAAQLMAKIDHVSGLSINPDASGYSFPLTDGTAGQALVTDGSGAISFSTISGDNIGTADLTVTGNRVLTLNSNYLAFNNGTADTAKIYGAGTAQFKSRVTIDGNGTVAGAVRLNDADSSHLAAIQAPSSLTGNYTLTLPDGTGTSGQALTTDGSGTLSWADAGASPGGTFSFSGYSTNTNYSSSVAALVVPAASAVTISNSMLGPNVGLGNALNGTQGVQNSITLGGLASGMSVTYTATFKITAGQGSMYILQSQTPSGGQFGTTYTFVSAAQGEQTKTLTATSTVSNRGDWEMYFGLAGSGQGGYYRLESLNITVS